MANEFLSELGGRLPQIALMFLAAKRGGPQALAAFQGGMQEAQQRQEALARQAQLDEERRALQAAQEERASSAETRAQDAAKRAEEAARIDRVQASLQYLDRYAQQQGETAPDAAAAENALLGRAASLESMFNVPQGQLSAAIPNMAPTISRRQKKLAEETYARAEKVYGAEAMANDSITLTTEAFGQVKPSQLRALFAVQATTPTGEPAQPFVPTPKVAAGSFEDYVGRYAKDRNKPVEQLSSAEIEDARKRYQQADDRQRVTVNTGNAPGDRRAAQMEDAFRKEPAVVRANVIAEGYSFASNLSDTSANPADDQALIYAFAKAMDPESVVREGEYATVQKYAQTWLESFKFNAQRVLSNTEFLTPEARRNIKNTIRQKYAASRTSYDNIRKQYASQLNRVTGQNDGESRLLDYAASFPSTAPRGEGGQPNPQPAPTGNTPPKNPYRP